jgi:hypothetical protein
VRLGLIRQNRRLQAAWAFTYGAVLPVSSFVAIIVDTSGTRDHNFFLGSSAMSRLNVLYQSKLVDWPVTSIRGLFMKTVATLAFAALLAGCTTQTVFQKDVWVTKDASGKEISRVEHESITQPVQGYEIKQEYIKGLH